MKWFHIVSLRLSLLSDYFLPWRKLLYHQLHTGTHNIQKCPLYEIFHLVNLHCLGSVVSEKLRQLLI